MVAFSLHLTALQSQKYLPYDRQFWSPTSNLSVFLDEALSSSRLRFSWLLSLSSSLFSASSWAALAPADRRLSAERRSCRFSCSSCEFSFSRASSWKAMFFRASNFFFRRRPSVSSSVFSFSREDTYTHKWWMKMMSKAFLSDNTKLVLTVLCNISLRLSTLFFAAGTASYVLLENALMFNINSFKILQ